MNKKQIGNFGEDLCTKYLERLGYKILRRNWYCRWGEIDIIANLNNNLVFVEVKTVTSDNFCKPQELFNFGKKTRLLRTINFFLAKNHIQNWKLDLVCLTKDSGRFWIEHYRNVLAF